MTGREVVRDTVNFAGPDRLPRSFPGEHGGTDFCGVGMSPSPDERPPSGVDEWGAVWENLGKTRLGEVKRPPLRDWDDLSSLDIPDIHDPRRWEALEGARERAGDSYLLGSGISIYERVHFIRGLENTWLDIHANREELCGLLDILVEMNIVAIGKYAEAGVDGFIFCDDWGLQDRLMIDPRDWRAIWKPRYGRIYRAAHEAGMQTFLHSCGYIIEILDDLIEAGLDVIQMDQQQNMGLEHLGERFGGRMTFYAPVDIQNTMVRGTTGEIRTYCRRMVTELGTPEGGFIPGYYGDPASVGHTPEAIAAMCDEFQTISREMYGR